MQLSLEGEVNSGGYIHRDAKPRQITPSEISIIIQMIRKENLIIVLLFIQNNSSFKNKLKQN